MKELRGRFRGEEMFSVGADGGRHVGADLLVQGVVDNRAVLQGHLGGEENKYM